MDRQKLSEAVLRAVRDNGGRATIVEIARHIWINHEADLKAAGDLFYTWQYEMRWTAQKLRNAGQLAYARENGRNVWQLVK
ncbi:hypothetical protein [Methylobacterium aquaticum]|uniref:hypothetical protein n=1 Tax=Methylobacterium aquaticum TaxID=270351 RepID=UPI0009E547BF|nr:hypothetical protein [Methylobacterium aquaticum]